MLELTTAYLAAAIAVFGLISAALLHQRRGWRRERIPFWLALYGDRREDAAHGAQHAPESPTGAPIAVQLRRLNEALLVHAPQTSTEIRRATANEEAEDARAIMPKDG